MIPNFVCIQLYVQCWYVSAINFEFLAIFVFLILYPQ